MSPTEPLREDASRWSRRSPSPRAEDRPVALWLFFTAAFLFVLALIGAITRLTDSGLSMMEWNPILGILPPLSEADWIRSFTLYQASAEFQEQYRGELNLETFKGIFWWEYIHRVWARLLGAVFALPFGYFLLRRRLPRWFIPHGVAALALGGAQGALGWFMVASGFEAGNIDVAPLRLAAHLALALLLYCYLIYLAWQLYRPELRVLDGTRLPLLRRNALALMGLLALVVVSGALVAGRDAGGLPASSLLGTGYFALDWPENWTRNAIAILVNHFVLATALLFLIARVAMQCLQIGGRFQRSIGIGLFYVVIQYGVGFSILELPGVPVWIGVWHQAGALILLALATSALFAAQHATLEGEPPTRSPLQD